MDAEVGIHLLLRAAVRIVTQPLQQEHVTAELLRNNGLSRALAADDDVIIVADQRLTAGRQLRRGEDVANAAAPKHHNSVVHLSSLPSDELHFLKPCFDDCFLFVR